MPQLGQVPSLINKEPGKKRMESVLETRPHCLGGCDGVSAHPKTLEKYREVEEQSAG
ncbi:unnamed protein product [Fusarium graminearum]|uniref:Chromosome 1, complete genome n=1 Tax=Gibberella zeae (strain ATCC MYA-4620 / CBS 123657 / FGSC 9075 / NRRL 31084 / PH-1) TaxID=229533 RepID=A0A098DBB0_GIBZE|nr:unnamed protein product [Fusarium graminearum]CZS79025.1 unnamed protein product [Fusarium graminearum]